MARKPTGNEKPAVEPEEKPPEDNTVETDVPEAGTDSPLLDMNDAAVKRMIKMAKAGAM